jgi:hypothetical protein
LDMIVLGSLWQHTLSGGGTVFSVYSGIQGGSNPSP